VQVYDVDKKMLYQYHRTDGNSGFEFFLAAERLYDFSVVPLSQGYSFYSELLDLRELAVSTRKKLDITLNSLASGVTFPLECLEFDNDSTLSKVSRFELSRIIKFLKNNPGIKAEIAVHRESWDPDSLSQADSTLVSGLPYDTAYIDEPRVSESSMDIVDSLETATEVNLVPPPDPTEVRAQAISNYLQERGVPDYVLEAKGYADFEPIAKDDFDEQPLLNRRVEIRIL
jgi:outer membrane protein OmpA-like peptidoglycan-associated protein